MRTLLFLGFFGFLDWQARAEDLDAIVFPSNKKINKEDGPGSPKQNANVGSDERIHIVYLMTILNK